MRRLGGSFSELVSAAGARHVLVPAGQVQRWSEASAHAWLCEAMEDPGTDVAALVELAVARGCASSVPDAVARFLAAEIAGGSLTAIALPEPPRGRPVLHPSEAPDWDDLRPISELIETDPSTELTWVSIEVVDHTGVPFAGLDVTLVHGDGRRDRVVLDDLGRHTARAVVVGSRTKVYWPPKLELSDEAKKHPGVNGFQRIPDDVAVPRDAKGKWSSLDHMGRHYRLVVEPPPRTPTLSYASSLFASDSALPTHALADLVTRAQETADRDHAARFGIFGHTDTHDDADANKQLADRRAQAVFGIFTGDWDTFLAAVEADELPLAAHQMMLRVLGCNPTAIDGEPGDQTSLAVASFRRAYNADTWHDEGRPRAYGDLAEGDALDAPTKDALLDAYHAEVSGKLDPERFLGPKHMGCGEFNPLTDDDRDNRRVTLAIYGDDAPADADFPCKHGDAGACQIDKGGRFSCKFYRERMRDEDVVHELTPFWDFEWLKTLSGKAHLSALTHLPDSNEVEFTIRRLRVALDADDCGVGGPPTDGEFIATVQGVIRGGVAYALWDHGAARHPFEVADWFRTSDGTGTDLRDYAPYHFTISTAGFWGRSDAPSHRLREVTLSEPDEGPILVLRTDGRLVLLDAAELPEADRTVRIAAVRRTGVATGGFST